jgi:hypothetical protein
MDVLTPAPGVEVEFRKSRRQHRNRGRMSDQTLKLNCIFNQASVQITKIQVQSFFCLILCRNLHCSTAILMYLSYLLIDKNSILLCQ